MRRLRAGLVPPLPGGPGAPPARHYDRAARSSLDWDWPTRLTAAEVSSQEARPGAEFAARVADECRDGAPRGVHLSPEVPAPSGVEIDAAPRGAPSPRR